MTYTKEHPLKVVTLCSGYDSQCLALNRLKESYPEFDYDLVAWSEFDPESKQPLENQPAVRAHNALFPQWANRNLGDMTKIDWTQVENFDLLFYSTPCQSISVSGLQHGFVEGSGTRSSIIWNVRDAVKEKRPKFLCLENVKAMVSKKFLPMFNLWQQELERLGYVNFAKVLNANDYGVAQHRERIFLVSIRADELEALAGNVQYHFPEPFASDIQLKDIIETQSQGIKDVRIMAMRGRNPENPSDRKTHSNGRFKQRAELGGRISNTLTSVSKDNYVVEIYSDEKDIENPGKQGITLPEELRDIPVVIRDLTPRECFRLMDVSDSDYDKVQQAGISNSAQYKMAANSIAVNVLFHLFRKMFIETGEERQQPGLF